MILTGSIVGENGDNTIKCPYCGSIHEYSRAHRLKRCSQNHAEKKKRHNMIQNIILKDMRQRFGEANVKTDSGVEIEGTRVEQLYSRLKPDILAWNEQEIHMIEFSSPYDMIRDDGSSTLKEVYDKKKEKSTG